MDIQIYECISENKAKRRYLFRGFAAVINASSSGTLLSSVDLGSKPKDHSLQCKYS